jgi:hypothetical protein
MTDDDIIKVNVWYDAGRRQWRIRCSECREEHGVASGDPNYSGPAGTAAYGHVSQAHPGGRPQLVHSEPEPES